MLALKDAASLRHAKLRPLAFFLRSLMTILAALGCVAVHKNFQAENFFLRPTQEGHDLYGVMLNFAAQLK
jgi:aminoglycoside/choline kinase family phosphotransferase